MPTGVPHDSVAVVIPARGAAESLPHALRSIEAQRPVRASDVVVAIDRHDSQTLQAIENHGVDADRPRWVDNPSGTTPSGLNRAVGATSANVVARLDAHAVMPSGYLTTALDVLAEHPEVGNVGGRQVPTAARGFAAAVAAAMRSPAGAGGAAYRTGTTAGPTDTVYLGVFRREALDQIGGFDERMLRNQDYELNIRLRKAGWTVWFDPRLEVTYRPRDTVRGLARQYFDYGRYRRLTARLHPGTLRPRQLAAPVLVLLGVIALLVGVFTSWLVPAIAGAGYLAVLLAAGVAADRRRGPAVALALAVMHLFWGVGFLLGPPRQAVTS